MDPITWGAILLGMQAAGMVFDYMGNEQQKKVNKKGLQLELQGINANIAMTRLQTEDASLQAMHQLRQNLGSQAAYFAATGARGNPAFAQKSISNFNQDEKTRRLNLIGKEAELRAQGQFARLGYQAQSKSLDQQFLGNVFNMLPISSGLNMLGGGANRANSARSNFSQPSVARNNSGFRPYTG